MTLFAKTFELGEIVETVFPTLSDDVKFALTDDEMADIIGFCIDSKGNVRKGLGFTSMSAETDDHPDYVPRNRYEMIWSPWNSHSLYLELQLPNPAEDIALYTLIRNAMLTELKIRIERHKKNAQARIRREAKKV
jgi:hypothetical protein